MFVERNCVQTMAVLLMLLASAATASAAPKPVPPSPYLGIVYRFADAMP